MLNVHYLTFDLSDTDDGIAILEAMASTSAAQHAAARAEAQQIVAWAQQHFPHSQGPIDEGMDWDHDLQVQVEDGHWHTVTLTLTGRPHVMAALLAAFGPADDD